MQQCQTLHVDVLINCVQTLTTVMQPMAHAIQFVPILHHPSKTQFLADVVTQCATMLTSVVWLAEQEHAMLHVLTLQWLFSTVELADASMDYAPTISAMWLEELELVCLCAQIPTIQESTMYYVDVELRTAQTNGAMLLQIHAQMYVLILTQLWDWPSLLVDVELQCVHLEIIVTYQTVEAHAILIALMKMDPLLTTTLADVAQLHAVLESIAI